MTHQQKLDGKARILHFCARETLRPIRDEILRLSGYEVNSTCLHDEAIAIFKKHLFSLVLVDVEGDDGVPLSERICSDVKTIHPGQLVAFICNWRVLIPTDCPDEILRTEFDPEAFVAGVRQMVSPGAIRGAAN